MASTKKRVIIVGGGIGGVQLAKKLDSDFDVILIDRRPTFYHNLASLRSLADASYIPKLFIPYSKVLKNGKFKRADVEEIGSDFLKLKGEDDTLTFDFLAVATGMSHSFPFPFSFDDVDSAKKHHTDLNKKVKDAEKILVVGGGAVGIEVACEITSKYPNKKVTLLHAGDKLFTNLMPEKFRDKVLHKLRNETKVEVILGDKIDFPSGSPMFFEDSKKTWNTSKGRDLEADITFFCIGGKPNNALFKTHFADKITDQGFVRVNQHLQLEGNSKIFVFGDVADTKEAKTGVNAINHVGLIAENLKLLKNKKNLKPLKPSPPVMFLTLGVGNGALVLPNGKVMGKTLVNLFKGDLFVKKFWKDFNQTVPK